MAFTETQKIDKPWMKILYGIATVGALTVTGAEVYHNPKNESIITLSLMMIVMIGVYYLVFKIRAETRIDTQGLSYKLPPFINSWKLLAWRDMQKIEVKRINAITDFGGWGIRFGWRKKGIILEGEHAVIVTKKDGKEFAITTSKPVEIENEIALRNPEIII